MVSIARKLNEIHQFMTGQKDKNIVRSKIWGFFHRSVMRVTEGRKQGGARCGWRMQ
jgi:hypothetical protein